MLAKLRNLLGAVYDSEPLVFQGALAGVIVLLGAQFGVVLDKGQTVIALVPIILSVLGRPFVTPNSKVS